MERKLLLIVLVSAFSIFLFGNQLSAQSGDVMVVDKVIHVNPRHPPKPTGRYIDNNQKKKKLKVKIRLMASWNCPTYLHYESKPQKARKKIIEKRRKKM